ncbi:MAG: ThiF family adenylyltransferase, partial [Algisphaera sp.]
VGCGALGTVVANMLARAGVGHLIVVDRDLIELTNLQRQVLFDEADVADATPKAIAVKNKIAKINSQVTVTAVVEDVNYTNMEKLALGEYGQGVYAGKKVDVIVDGLDNFETRYLVNDCAVKHGIAYVYGGAVGTVGASYAVLPHTEKGDAVWETLKGGSLATPCLQCIFEKAPPPGLNPTCDTVGVLGPVVAMVSNYQVAETLKMLTGHWDRVSPTMLNLDLWANTFRPFKVARAYDVGDCRCCKHRAFGYLNGSLGSSATTLCGRNAVQLSPALEDHGAKNATGRGKLDFAGIAKRLEAHGPVKVNAFMLQACVVDGGESYELTLFTDGRAIVKGTPDVKVAKGVYAKYVGM